jgi:hypothetical protein
MDWQAFTQKLFYPLVCVDFACWLCCCVDMLQLAHQPEYHVGWRDHDQIYMAWQVFGEMFFNDSSTVR